MALGKAPPAWTSPLCRSSSGNYLSRATLEPASSTMATMPRRAPVSPPGGVDRLAQDGVKVEARADAQDRGGVGPQFEAAHRFASRAKYNDMCGSSSILRVNGRRT